MNATCAEGVPYRSGDPLFMTSLARGLHVIRALLEAGDRQTIAELSRATGLHRAVVRRCLYTLGELGYASKEGRTYCLGPQIAIRERSAAAPIAGAARPILAALSRRLGERSAVAVLEHGKVTYLACAASNGAPAVPSLAGACPPAFRTAAGRILLASLSQQHAMLEVSRREILSRARTEGYAITEEDSQIGVRALAVPVRSVLGATVAAMEMNIRGRLPCAELIEHYLPLLKTAAVALGRGLQPSM